MCMQDWVCKQDVALRYSVIAIPLLLVSLLTRRGRGVMEARRQGRGNYGYRVFVALVVLVGQVIRLMRQAEGEGAKGEGFVLFMLTVHRRL